MNITVAGVGYVGLARMLYGGAIYGWSREPLADLEDARTAALRAVALDPRDAYGYFAAAGAALYLGHHEEALEQAQRALSLYAGADPALPQQAFRAATGPHRPAPDRCTGEHCAESNTAGR